MHVARRAAQELVDNNEAHFADAGGFVSPSGISYIGVSKEKLGKVRLRTCCSALYGVALCAERCARLTLHRRATRITTQAACAAVKRINLDIRVAKNAQRNGADLKENFEVR